MRKAEFYARAVIDAVGLPKTQEECCAIAAKVSLAVGPVPKTERETLDAAYGMAAGLFDKAFDAADYGQRTAWIDMCERALRCEMEAIGQRP